MEWLDEAIRIQREKLTGKLSGPMQHLAGACSLVWQDSGALDQVLCSYAKQVKQHPCRLLYAMAREGVQVSSNISGEHLDDTCIGQDLSARPYIREQPVSGPPVVLSDVYVDKQSKRPCITALCRVEHAGGLLGFVAADFDLKDLGLEATGKQAPPRTWRQIKGDPSIRGTLFQQSRTISAMDEHLDDVLPVVTELMTEQGVFHAKLHFSSSRATVWHMSDPYRYQLLVLDEIIDPRICLAYAKTSFPRDALVEPGMIAAVFDSFRRLREADETIYLRAASLNIMNGMVGLNFSCDGSHYMPHEEFLGKPPSFWFGTERQARQMCPAEKSA